MILIIILLIINTYFAFKNAERVICKAPNKFAHIFAPPGTGKTTLCASLVRKSIIENKKIYSNVPIRGAIKIDLKKMGYDDKKLEETLQMFDLLPVSPDGSYLLLDALADAYTSYRQGDEKATERVLEVCDILQGYADVLSMAGDTATAQVLLLVKNLYAGMYVDSPSPDNSLVIYY